MGTVSEIRAAACCALMWLSMGCAGEEVDGEAPSREDIVQPELSGEVGTLEAPLVKRRWPPWVTRDAGVRDAGPTIPPDAGLEQDECGGSSSTPLTADTTGKRADMHGFVELQASSPSQYRRLKTRLTVPAKPQPSGTIFLWPGLQPLDGAHYFPIDNGVLQPVLTWGPSCAPGSPYDYESWWISAQYVNVFGSEPGYQGCMGGPVMRVEPGDVLELDIVGPSTGTIWTQTVTSRRTGESVSYAIDMRGQEQGRAIFDVELPTGDKPNEDVLFTSTVLTYDAPLTSPCTPVVQGESDFVARSRLSPDGLRCCIDRITLRAQGVPATTTP